MNLSVVDHLGAGGKATLATKDVSGTIVVMNDLSNASIVCVPKEGVSQTAWAQASLDDVKQHYPNVKIENGHLWLESITA